MVDFKLLMLTFSGTQDSFLFSIVKRWYFYEISGELQELCLTKAWKPYKFPTWLHNPPHKLYQGMGDKARFHMVL